MNSSDKNDPEKPVSGIIFSDFDGTLFSHEGVISNRDYQALSDAGEAGYIRVIATGRSLFSFRKILKTANLPLSDYIDYLIFSSGTGILDIGTDKIIESTHLSEEEASEAAGFLLRQGIDFMIQERLPDNHRMICVKSNGSVNPDFYRRIRIYSDYAANLEIKDDESEIEAVERACKEGAAQLVAIIPPAAGVDPEKYPTDLLDFLRRRLTECSVIRTTSPIDRRSLWIEIFNRDVSKSQAARRLARRFGLGPEDCLAIGNDFNDEDLLIWAGTARSVDEAPELLKRRIPSAGSSSDSAVARAYHEFHSGRKAAADS